MQLQLRQKRTKAKRALPTLVVGHAVQRRRCLHGLCHGPQWPWLTSPVLSASPTVARARRALNHLHPLVTSGSANNSVCFLRVHSSSWPCPRYSEQLSARSHRWSVHPAPQIFKGKPRASCEAQRRTQSVRLVEAPAQDGDLVAMCMMSVGPPCGSCVCGCYVCHVHAWMPCHLGHG